MNFSQRFIDNALKSYSDSCSFMTNQKLNLANPSDRLILYYESHKSVVLQWTKSEHFHFSSRWSFHEHPKQTFSCLHDRNAHIGDSKSGKSCVSLQSNQTILSPCNINRYLAHCIHDACVHSYVTLLWTLSTPQTVNLEPGLLSYAEFPFKFQNQIELRYKSYKRRSLFPLHIITYALSNCVDN